MEIFKKYVEPRPYLVFSRNIKQIVKKKYFSTSKDKKEWIAYTKQMDDISVKEVDLQEQDIKVYKVPKLDLHGFSLTESNKVVKKFIKLSNN